MSERYFLSDMLKGGPGLDGYALCGDVLCPDCAQRIIREKWEGLTPEEREEGLPWHRFVDSECWPQPIFFGESEYREVCSAWLEEDGQLVMCGEHLYGPEEEEPQFDKKGRRIN